MKKILMLLLVTVLLSGCSIQKTDDLTNSQKFNNEYAVGENNPFVYISVDKLEKLFKDGTGILLFSNSDCEWCLSSVDVFNDILNKNDIDSVYYLNPSILSDDNKNKLLYLINEEIEDIEINEIVMPSVYIVIDGEIIDYCDKSFEVKYEDDGTLDNNKKKLKKAYEDLVKVYKEHE